MAFEYSEELHASVGEVNEAIEETLSGDFSDYEAAVITGLLTQSLQLARITELLTFIAEAE